MSPEFKFNDNKTAYIPERVLAIVKHSGKGKKEELILIQEPISPQRVSEIQMELRHGQKGLVSARQVGKEIYSFGGAQEVYFDPDATIVVSKSNI